MTSSLCIHHSDVPLETESTYVGSYRRSSLSEYDDTPLSVSFDTLQHLMAHAQNLKDTIQALRSTSSNTQISSTHVQTELSHAADSADELRDFLDACWERIPVVKRPSARSAVVAQKVFDIPELLENICTHFDIRDALKAQQVGRVWRDGINSSVQMQRAMGLRIHADANFFVPLQQNSRRGVVSFPGMMIDTYDYETERSGMLFTDDITQMRKIKIILSTSVPISVGARCRAISLCQPPLKRATLRVSHNCRRNKCEETVEEYEITSDEAIRVEDVLNAVQGALDDFCPCGWHAHGGYDSASGSDLHDDRARRFASDEQANENGSDSGDENNDEAHGEDGDTKDDAEGNGHNIGHGEGGTDQDAGSEWGSDSGSTLDIYSHNDCELDIEVLGSVTLKEDDPIMVERRRKVAFELALRERIRRSSIVSSSYSDYN